MRIGNYKMSFVRYGDTIPAHSYFYAYGLTPLTWKQKVASEDCFKELAFLWAKLTKREWQAGYTNVRQRVAEHHGFIIQWMDEPAANEWGEVAP